MYKLALVFCSVTMLSTPVLAGTLKNAWHCKDGTTQKMDVGDIPGHAYVIAQGECSATSGTKGVDEKSGAFTEFRDMKSTGVTNHGRFLVTAGNGDKIFYTYAGSASADSAKPASNKWTIDGGTGKYAKAKGSGKCTGKRNADETSDWQCTGTFNGGK